MGTQRDTGNSFGDAVQEMETAGAGLKRSTWTVLLQSAASAWFALFRRDSATGAWEWVTYPGPGEEESVPEPDVGLPDGDPDSWPERVFELRGFRDGAEVRWVIGREPVRISGCGAGSDAGGDGGLESRLLLWGTAAADGAGGWTVMSAARIGHYPLPLQIGCGLRAALVMQEQLTRDDHGNVGVSDVIWTGLAEVTPDKEGNVSHARE